MSLPVAQFIHPARLLMIDKVGLLVHLVVVIKRRPVTSRRRLEPVAVVIVRRQAKLLLCLTRQLLLLRVMMKVVMMMIGLVIWKNLMSLWVSLVREMSEASGLINHDDI